MPTSSVSTGPWIAVALATVAVSVAACGGSSSKPERSYEPWGFSDRALELYALTWRPEFPRPGDDLWRGGLCGHQLAIRARGSSYG